MVRQILEGLIGNQAKQIPCLALTDSKNLWSCIHNISSCSDPRLQGDIISIRQAIHEDKTIQEVRYIHSSQMLADCLTKQTNITGQMLLNTARSGVYSVPGGTTLRDSTLTSVKTWDQLMSAEKSSQNGTLIPVNVTYSTDKHENCFSQWDGSIQSPNVWTNDRARNQTGTQLSQLQNSTIVSK